MDFLEEKYKLLVENGIIDSNLYEKYNVKRGLRNSNGTGVLVGLTKVANVEGYKMEFEDGEKKPCPGHLCYRGYDLMDIASADKDTYGFEKVSFLLLFGYLPNEEEMTEFKKIVSDEYELPKEFVEGIILKNPSKSLMNHISRCILSLYSYDENPDSNYGLDLLKKGISLIAKMPAIISYSLMAKNHYIDKDSLFIHYPKKEYSIAENILYLSRCDGKFSRLEADTLDLALMIHADHGGGNNSTFVGVVVASTGADIYSCLAASLGSLKGPRHGGANMAVLDMMNLIINDVGMDATDEELENIIGKILSKNYYDNSGLIYGIGHAIYTMSDPRCVLLKAKCQELSQNDDNNIKLFEFYNRFENLAIEILGEKKNMVCCANVDYYSGLTYQFLKIPRDLFIPIFAAARMSGWMAHNIESSVNGNKIVRPATKYVGGKKELN